MDTEGSRYNVHNVTNITEREDENSENSWIYEADSYTEKIAMIVYTSFAVFFSILGNSFVIYATTQYTHSNKNFGVAKTTVFMIRQLAMADMLFTVLIIVPHMVTLVYGTWVLGEAVCHVIIYCHNIPAVSTVSYILAISLHRYLRCRQPVGTRRRCPSWLTASLIWAYSLIPTLVKLGLGFNPGVVRTLGGEVKKCMTLQHRTLDHNILTVINIAQTDIPILITIALNVKLLMYAQSKLNTMTHHNRNAIITTASICWVLICSHSVREITELLTHLGNMEVDTTIKKVATALYYLNSFCNFMLYLMVNRSFRQFTLASVVWRKKRELAARVHQGVEEYEGMKNWIGARLNSDTGVADILLEPQINSDTVVDDILFESRVNSV